MRYTGTNRRWALGILFVLVLAAGASGCGEGAREPDTTEQVAAPPPMAYPISERGGTPATGPGERYNHCERIWCLVHGENYFIDHFLRDHMGYVIHDMAHGDVFVLRWQKGGPDLSGASRAALLLCGQHVHPWIFAKHGGAPVRHTGFSRALGYPRRHFDYYGTRLEPCCVNGLGFNFIHSDLGIQFRFHDLAEYREHPEMGWHKPFAARIRPPAPSRDASVGD